MRLYLDNRCYNRPFDDQSQARIHIESAAVLSIVKRARVGKEMIIGSAVLSLEMSQLSDAAKKQKVQVLYGIAGENIPFSSLIEKRAEAIMKATMIRSFDALHIASAEAGQVDYFLTTDDKLVKACANTTLTIKVINPLKYITEVIGDE